MFNNGKDDKVKMFKRAIRGENYSSIAKDYGYSAATVRTFVKEIIASIDTPENREKLIAAFPFAIKKFERAYDRRGNYYSIVDINIVHLKPKSEFLIELVQPTFVVPTETEEKRHLLVFLAFEIKNFLAGSYHTINTNKNANPELVIQALDNPQYITERLKKMSLVGSGLDYQFEFSMLKIREKILVPNISHTEPNKELQEQTDDNLYDEMISLMEEINCFHYVFA